MSIAAWTWLLIGLSFALYIGIALWSQARNSGDFYVAQRQVHPVLNGMATGSDWMSAASFISLAGMISLMGRDGSIYLMGWTGGYVLLAMLLAPYLRKYGKYTVPQFVGDRYYSNGARLVALICAIFVSFVYVIAQMRGVGVVFARFLQVPVHTGVFIGMVVVFVYTAIGGMKGITYTQAAQYIILIIAFLVPTVFIAKALTGNPVPQLAFGSKLTAGGAQALGNPELQGQYLLDVLNGLHKELGFTAYTSGNRPMTDLIAITLSLMVGTAGLPHIIIRFFTVPTIRDARASAGWALLFITILYTTAPALAAFSRAHFIAAVNGKPYASAPAWFKTWEKTGLLAWHDKNRDGIITYAAGEAFIGKPEFLGGVGAYGQLTLRNKPTTGPNELYLDPDIVVLATPEIASLPNWVVGFVAAGAVAAALSIAAGLLIVITAAISNDLIKGIVAPNISEKDELWWARGALGVAVLIAGYFGVNPPGHVAQMVAYAFSLAASSFFPAIFLGIFWKKTTMEGAISGMLSGIFLTAGYIFFFELAWPASNVPAKWLFGISPEGIGAVGMVLNFIVAVVVSKLTNEPPKEVQDLVENLRYPK